MTWHLDIEQQVLAENYEPVIQFYEQLAQDEPDVITHGWYLGLAHLLGGQEEAAQATWLFCLAQVSDIQVNQCIDDLCSVLVAEAERQSDHLNCAQTALLIRHHIYSICPSLLSNLLNLVLLSIELKSFTPEDLERWNLIRLLEEKSQSSLDANLLEKVLLQVLEYPSQEALDFAEASAKHLKSLDMVSSDILSVSHRLAYQSRYLIYAIALAEFCHKFHPSNPDSLRRLSNYYKELKDYPQALAVAKKYAGQNLPYQDHVLSQGLVLQLLMCSGSWQEVPQQAKYFRSLHKYILQKSDEVPCINKTRSMFIDCSLLFYQEDSLQDNRSIVNESARRFADIVWSQKPDDCKFEFSRRHSDKRRLKVAYIGQTFRQHSVGWLCRWLFQHHNRESFEIGIYFVNYNQVNQNLDNPFFQSWFKPHIDFAHCMGRDPHEIAKQIYEDQVDILVDVDCLTLDLTCHVMALKPAPIQVSWLGYDATGLPTVDYFIADSHVLKEDAQKHYCEKIWRLPQTYVAVDGFEVGVPTLRRETLDIPSDAIIYLSAQAGQKRHPDTVRLQMRIIKAVSNSYFLIKGPSDQSSLQQFFLDIAEEEGVNPNRLRFLPFDANEQIHRANLKIADIVLDTYPYNGATTTLETLWMEIPLVTRVGDQFAARNSYAFMMNVGIQEGISWSDEEYINWGIRLGQEPELRQHIAWRLRQSKQMSPLWDSKKFTLEMENAYQQMASHSLLDISTA